MRAFRPAATGGSGMVITKVREPDGHDSELPSHKKQELPYGRRQGDGDSDSRGHGLCWKNVYPTEGGTKSLTSLPGEHLLVVGESIICSFMNTIRSHTFFVPEKCGNFSRLLQE